VRRPRVGHIEYLNCLPLYHGLVRDGAILDMDLRQGTPAELNRQLLEGRLDIAPISSIEYLRHADELLLLPEPTVSSDGPVQSIALVSRLPAAALDRRPVALTTTSATSQVLTRIILSERYGVAPCYLARPPDLQRMLAEADAALLIGDPALRVLWQPPPGLYCYDLGQEWQLLTGQAMIYAVWAVRREYAARAPHAVAAVLAALQRALRYSLEHLAEIACAAARWEPLPAAALERYFRTLRFGFGPRFQAGLLEYARRAVRHDALSGVPALEFFVPPSPEHRPGRHNQRLDG
jgi:chorismate dehydratase